MNELAKKLTSIILVCDDPNEFDGVFEEIQENIQNWINKNNVHAVKVYVDEYGVEDCWTVEEFKNQINHFASDIEVNIVDQPFEYLDEDNVWYLEEDDNDALESRKESKNFYYDESGASFSTLIQKIN